MVGVGWEAVIPLDENSSWHSDTDSSHLLLSDMRELIKVQNVCASADMRQHTQRHALATEPGFSKFGNGSAPRHRHVIGGSTPLHTFPFPDDASQHQPSASPWCL